MRRHRVTVTGQMGRRRAFFTLASNRGSARSTASALRRFFAAAFTRQLTRVSLTPFFSSSRDHRPWLSRLQRRRSISLWRRPSRRTARISSSASVEVWCLRISVFECWHRTAVDFFGVLACFVCCVHAVCTRASLAAAGNTGWRCACGCWPDVRGGRVHAQSSGSPSRARRGRSTSSRAPARCARGPRAPRTSPST